MKNKTKNEKNTNLDNVKTKNKKIFIAYSNAVRWCHNDIVLCNNIVEIDDSIYDNMRWNNYDEETDSYEEIYQWYITNCSEWDVEFLEKSFDLKFTYSDKLDCYILCVTHYGTSWDSVPCEVKNPEISWIADSEHFEYDKVCKLYRKK